MSPSHTVHMEELVGGGEAQGRGCSTLVLSTVSTICLDMEMRGPCQVSFSIASLPHFWRQGFLFNPELTDAARLDGQQSLEIDLSVYYCPSPGLTGC